jgi:ubiquinone/menaquinone biosynthesis C-methylase UbiE
MSKIYENYFNPKTVAERYLKGRPQYHSFMIGKIKEFLSIRKPFEFALDVGCGTGFSSIALREISEQVVGVDLSVEMVDLAIKKNGVEYIVSSAENLPFFDKNFDLITVSQAIHWIDRNKFFAEADRVLKPGSFIIAYDNYFLGKIPDNPDFNVWFKERFLRKFPTPPRTRKDFDKVSKNPKGFVLVKEEWYENTIELSKQNVVDYLITITNVIDRVENGGETIKEVSNWLVDEIEHFFIDIEKNKFVFTAPIWYLRQGE